MTQNLENEKINAALDMLIESDSDWSNILGKEGLIKQLSKCILERALEAEMQSHLVYDRYERNASENARNGSFKKNLTTENGQVELEVPRDRNGNFEPVIVKKKQTRPICFYRRATRILILKLTHDICTLCWHDILMYITNILVFINFKYYSFVSLY